MNGRLDFDAPPPLSAAAAPRDAAGRVAWLRLARSRGVGAAAFIAAIRRFGSAEAALEAGPAGVRSGGRPVALADAASAEAELAAGAALGARLLCLGEAAYPPLLARIADPPPALWALGPRAEIGAATVAVVGARNASANGLRFAEELAEGLAAQGLAVVSGLARGIDAAAHRGALADGSGATAAVVAGGVDHVYPPENAALRAQICAEGALYSEMPIGHHPSGQHFPRRNRIISGLAQGVVVVEGALRSGSMITARLAAEQGREAMATPGHPYDARADGPNALIRDGAPLVRHVEDVLEALAPRLAAPPRPRAVHAPPLRPTPAPVRASTPPDGLAPLAAAVLAQLSPAPAQIDALTRALGAEPAAVAAAISTLELTGRALRHPGGAVSLAPPPRD